MSLLECVEFTEKNGGRTVSLKIYLEQEKRREIDVYRLISSRIAIEFNSNTKEVTERKIELDAKALTNCMRKMTGLPYGWKRIWWIATHKMAGFRLLHNPASTIDDTYREEIIYPVCSSALAHCCSKVDYDVIKNKADGWTEPAHFANSPLLSYLFTFSPVISTFPEV